MKVYEIPEHLKSYVLTLQTGKEILISANEKEGISKSQSQFVELRNGEIVNKSYIVSITLEKEKSRANFYKSEEFKALQAGRPEYLLP